MKQSELITAALKGDATLVVKNARVVNVFTNEILEGDVALSEDTIIGVGKGFAAREEIDAGGAYLCPGFIDARTKTLRFKQSLLDNCLLQYSTIGPIRKALFYSKLYHIKQKNK